MSLRRFAPLALALALIAFPVAAPAQGGSMVGDAEAPPTEVDLSFLSGSSWIVAKVNDEIVTRHEVLEKIKVQLLGLQTSYAGDALRRKAQELWDKTLSELVEERVMLQKARTEGVEVTWKDVDKALDDEIKRAGSRERFDQNLAQTGQTLDDFRENLRKQIMMRDLIYRLVGIKDSGNKKEGVIPDDPVATPAEIHAYYEKHRADFFLEEKVQVQQIILKYSDDKSRRSVDEIAASLVRQLAVGGDYDTLARWYTAVRAEESGLWDWTPRGSLPPEVDERAFAMKPGEISPVIDTGNTLRIVRLRSRQEARQRSFAEVQEEIKKIVQNKRIYDAVDKIKRDLFKNQYIWPPGVLRPK